MFSSILKFCPVNKWKVDTDGPTFQNDPTRKNFIIDLTTNDRYLNESKTLIRKKCAALFLACILIHPIKSIINIIWRISKLVIFYEFWKKPNKANIRANNQIELDLEFKRRLTLKYKTTAYFKDIFRILFTPLAIPLLGLSAIYGVIRPYDGRKLHASIEAALYDRALLASCFQPNPTHHLFGGDIHSANTW